MRHQNPWRRPEELNQLTIPTKPTKEIEVELYYGEPVEEQIASKYRLIEEDLEEGNYGTIYKHYHT